MKKFTALSSLLVLGSVSAMAQDPVQDVNDLVNVNAVIELALAEVDGVVRQVEPTGTVPRLADEFSTYDASFPLTVRGTKTVNSDCALTLIDGELNFNKNGGLAQFDQIDWMLLCGEDREEVEVYASTNAEDPETGRGSTKFLGLFSPTTGDPWQVNVDLRSFNPSSLNEPVTTKSDGYNLPHPVIMEGYIDHEQYNKMKSTGGTLSEIAGQGVYIWIK